MRLSVDGYLGCFHTLATVNDAAVSIVGGGHISFQINFFFGYIHRSGISGSYGSFITNRTTTCKNFKVLLLFVR